MRSYDELMIRRVTWSDSVGFSPIEIHGWLFDHQKKLVDYALNKGRSAIFADTGLGKTAMELSWSENVYRHTGRPVLLATPLAVAKQIEAESERFGIESKVDRSGKVVSSITITNFENIHKFNPNDFSGLVVDESSAIKNFDGKRKEIITDFCSQLKYRLLSTATAAPNDFHELGTSSEALGYLGFRDMITTFFRIEQEKNGLAWGRTKYRFRGHAERPFWQWVSSWARAIRKPSDIGCSDDLYVLPELKEIEHCVVNSTPRDGWLLSVPAVGLREEREERRVTLAERCELAASLASGDQPAVVWCQLNPEGDLLEKLIPDSVQVKGSMSDEQKEDYLHGFSTGKYRVLVTKPKIGAWGLNWQHCNNVITFPGHSFEQYYQSVRRCWRFGQSRPVSVHIVTTEGEAGVLDNLRAKQAKADRMFSELVACMNREIALAAKHTFHTKEELPSWL
jgi:Helicase conserved C-terminal domain